MDIGGCATSSAISDRQFTICNLESAIYNLIMLILASSSPRRQELLCNAGIKFRVQPADVPEILQDGEHPTSFAERLARDKASAVFRTLNNDAATTSDSGGWGAPSASVSPDPPIVLGADTVVVVDERVLGKPGGVKDAARVLRL